MCVEKFVKTSHVSVHILPQHSSVGSMIVHVHKHVMHLSVAIPGRGWSAPRNILGNSAGFADFCRQGLAWDGGIGPLCTSEARYTGICNIAAILKMKDLDHKDRLCSPL